jgi:hypothetical protein
MCQTLDGLFSNFRTQLWYGIRYENRYENSLNANSATRGENFYQARGPK